MALPGWSQALHRATAPARSAATTASALLSPSPAQRPGPDHPRLTRPACADLRRLATPRTTTTPSLARNLAASASGPAAAAAAAAPAPAPSAPSLECEVQQATTAAELRAAAFLRAVSFYTYPPGRSEYAARSHRHMKANAEWESVTAKVEGRDVAYRDLDVTCFIATVDDSTDGPATAAAGGASGSDARAATEVAANPPAASNAGPVGATATATATADCRELLAALRGCLDASAQLPAEAGSGRDPRPGGDPRVGGGGGAAPPRPRRLVVGSLDLNVGHTLPSEELIGRNPQADPRQRRAYLSNVCVAPAARRLGVARALLRHVESVARRAGVEWLYVHVVADNAPAVALYCDALGFQVEQSESEGYARSLQRPRRLLLAKCLVTPEEPRQPR